MSSRVAASDERSKVVFGSEVEESSSCANRSPAVGFDEVNDPVLVELEIHQDAGHDLLPRVWLAARRLASKGTEAASGLLLLDKAARPTKENSSGAVAAQLAAERTKEDGVAVVGESVDTGGNVTSAKFAAHPKCSGTWAVLLGVVHRHGGYRLGEIKANTQQP